MRAANGADIGSSPMPPASSWRPARGRGLRALLPHGGLDPADRNAVIDAEGRILTPGYVDIHAHGAWEKSFDDGPDGIDVARAGHAVHGTTRQVLSLITNPWT